MAPTTQTKYLAGATGTTTTLAQVNVVDIRTKLATLRTQREAVDTRILQLTEALHAGWKAAAADPTRAEQISADIEREHRLRTMQDNLIEAAERDLATAEAQISVDRISAVAARFDALMTEKTGKARNVVAACLQLAEMVKELALIDRQAKGLFSTDATVTGLDYNKAAQTIGRVEYQHYVEQLIESQLVPANLWNPNDRPIFGYPKDVNVRLVDAVDGERRDILASIAMVLDRVSAGVSLKPEPMRDLAGESLAAAQAKATREAQAG